MDWSTSSLINSSPLSRRLPGQRTPPDPTIEQPNAADITYGWHQAESSSSSGSSGSSSRSSRSSNDGYEHAVGGDVGEGAATGVEAHPDTALRRRRRASTSSSSGDDSMVSFDTTEEEHIAEAQGSRGEQDGPRPPPPPPSPPPPRPHAPEQQGGGDAEELFICRICFDGPNDESLGKLIAPCRCRGTMKFVHSACLTRWRALSTRQSSVVACDQCGAAYRFRKSRFVGMATNQYLLFLVTLLLFTLLVWTVGFAAEGAVRRWEGGGPSTVATTSKSSSILDSLFGSDDDEAEAHDERRDSVYYYDSFMGAYTLQTGSYYYFDSVGYWSLFKAAVRHVGSGRALNAAKELVRGDAERDDGGRRREEGEEEEEELGIWQSLKHDWLYGPSGLWPTAKSAGDGGVGGDERVEGSMEEEKSVGVEDVPAKTEEASAPRRTHAGERYDARQARPLAAGEAGKRSEKKVRKPGKSAEPAQEPVPGILDRIAMQFSLGFSIVGIFSFINLLLGISFWGPFHLGNFGLGRGFARLTGSARRRGGGGGGGGGGQGSDGGTIASVVLLLLVIIGILRALHVVFKIIRWFSRKLLTRLEDYIIDWGGDEEVHEEPAPAPVPAPAAP
ncbi:hypothetical protein FA10DRAFT_265432 [Acaromyces ingoldii]|uniref:RING-CH-type domain-containing protein n=1 Tax=Acaromyces ingoldii TaxID=215250 RepID=A0A316YRY8_9BASI|nr:hypothetical protein FA10DRAFT_265432 [Acaromyces ingoldii]PWN91584.1 hypothetical protein FA10DRAFT_265432 [Acaromyces ingoldii]